MPYGRRNSSKINHRNRRQRSASTLQRAWRRTKAPKKKSAVVRQTEQNRKEIKKLKGDREIKYARTLVATLENNLVGQLLSKQKVDNYGLCMDSQTWVAAAGAQYLPQALKTSYQPLWVCPTAILQQGVTAYNRIGDDVVMTSLNIKGTMIGSDALTNGGIFINQPQKQTLHMYVILDKNPAPENTSNPPVYSVNCTPAQTFQYDPTWNNTLPPGFSTATFRGVGDHLKSCTQSGKNPSGLSTNYVQKDLLNLSYWSKDEGGISTSDRFKLLKHFKYNCSQTVTASVAGGGPTSYNSKIATKGQRDFSETIKGNYKFHFPNDKAQMPDNQRIYLVFCSETPTLRFDPTSGAGNPPTSFIPAPSVTLACSFNYTDS